MFGLIITTSNYRGCLYFEYFKLRSHLKFCYNINFNVYNSKEFSQNWIITVQTMNLNNQDIIYSKYLITFTFPVVYSVTNSMSYLSMHNPYGSITSSIYNKNCPSLSKMWIQWLLWSAVRIWPWLFVVIPNGLKGFLLASEGWPV